MDRVPLDSNEDDQFCMGTPVPSVAGIRGEEMQPPSPDMIKGAARDV